MLLEKIYQSYAENFSKSEYVKIIYSANAFHDLKRAVEIAVFKIRKTSNFCKLHTLFE